MYILGIDSTNKRMSISINCDESLLCELEDDKSQRFIVNIISFIDKVLVKSKIPLQKIDAYCVNLGPGDFTGTRIGISVVKILAWIQNKPIYGINSLDVFAAGIALNNKKTIEKSLINGKSLFIWPLMDVKRGELYFALYKIIDNEVEKKIENKIIEGKITEGKELPTKSLDKKSRSSKTINYKTIVKILLKNESYILCRVSEYCLAEKDNFIKGFKSIFSANIKEGEFILGGNAFESYKDLKKNITDVNSNIADVNNKDLNNDFTPNKLFIFDKKNKFPESKYLNLCTYYHAALENKPGDSNIAPVYVRDFAPFP
jgi:tRNA threonylcarbamoyladenosine biosynthesis protein TsaB